MLRIHLLQLFFGHSDPAMEEALHDIPLYREFAQLDAGFTRLPDESTILRLGTCLSKTTWACRYWRRLMPRS
jgi:IS5 family transposase